MASFKCSLIFFLHPSSPRAQRSPGCFYDLQLVVSARLLEFVACVRPAAVEDLHRWLQGLDHVPACMLCM
jgi:hypothetical protein